MPRAAPPAHAPGKQRLAGRLCTDVRVRLWGVEFEARVPAGREGGSESLCAPAPVLIDRLSRLGIGIYLCALGCLKNSAIPLGVEWHIGTSDLSEQMGSIQSLASRACAPRTHGHWPAGRPTP